VFGKPANRHASILASATGLQYGSPDQSSRILLLLYKDAVTSLILAAGQSNFGMLPLLVFANE